ncbi:hypothetical protein PoB_003120100 [Plakobranchus ocellatus]|uniref:LolA-like domain-containing protein n=1 Tax=Plakobranchus ocellatus TaxID=259542 RepID=A0AAV4ADF5_9GAST|nr:hypothetical protein PoB_003120100 [Plakobranchus ocellatus]
MLRNVWLTCMLGLVAFKAQGSDDFQCVDTGPSAPWAPHMPTVTKDSDSYQATVEVNIVDKGYSYVIEEYLDYEGNRGLMISNRNGQKSTFIFSYDTDELFSIIDDHCSVSNISDNRFGFIFGSGSKTSVDHRHIFGSAAVLRFAADIYDVYNGTSEVRGIPADVYSTCISWPGVVGTARVAYYFSSPGWNMSAPRQQLPLRIEVEGISSVPTRGQRDPADPNAQTAKPRHFHHVYDFVNYLPYIAVDPSVFLTPPNIVCENRVITKTFPKLGRYFSFRSEKVDPLSGIIEHRAVWYDLDAKMIRHDFRWQPPGAAQYTNGITTITDFNTGVDYSIDHVSGCRTSPAKALDLGAHKETQAADGMQFFTIDLQDPNSVFYLNINYTYVGQASMHLRGLMFDLA